ncbi:MAG TPA: transcriptional regulator [Verrucomicrobia bacterium]|nr:MAG: transcriptional regulator [Lentisphaerae bacterium GWF2_57_35]HBA84699.1 transcriptional regulator [Verrucomicrobiota bacterium]
MNENHGLPLSVPQILPALDAYFRPAALVVRAFRERVRTSGQGVPVRLALEQADGSVFHFDKELFDERCPEARGNYTFVERMVKFLLWSRGGCKVYFAGPASVGERLKKHYMDNATGSFDADIMGRRIYERPFEVVLVRREDLPPAREKTVPLGRHLNGCRIGFDLGASDRKVAAVIDGQPVFTEEVVWNPVQQTDPQWHFDEIMDSLKRAAGHLPRVDAIGGSSAGVYVNNRVKVASLFRGVPSDLFERRVKDLFLEIKKAWNDIPFELVNDGEVTALAGSMSIGDNGVLGMALGSSLAAGYVTLDGRITSWLNELAFAPVDYNPQAPVDEWSGDYGCGVQYLSQQGVGRLIPRAGIEVDEALPLPEKLKQVQKLMAAGDPRASKIYQTLGAYLGYALAHYADFYAIRNVLILGRVTTGEGGRVIMEGAKEVLRKIFPDVHQAIAFHIPDEKDKRHGQAVAAASLPVVG